MRFNKFLLRVLLLVILLPVILSCNAQGQRVSGMVTGNNERLSGVVVRNLGNHDKANSDDRGMFSIKVANGDTLLCSKEFYKTDTSVYNGQDYLVIQLKQPIRVLQEVVVKDTMADALKVYNQNKKDYKDIYWKGDDKQIFSIPFVLGPELGVNLNIDKLYSALSKQGKDARRLQHTLTGDYRNSVVDHRFNKTLVSRITGYKGDKLDDFIARYRPTYAFIVKASTYDIIEYIKQKKAANKS